MQPLAIGVLVFMTVFLSMMALSARAREREVVAERLLAIEAQRAPRGAVLALPFYRRALLPLAALLVQMVTRLTPPHSIAAVRSNFERAGRRHSDPVMWILFKWADACLLGGAVYAAGVVLHSPPAVRLPLALGVAILGYVWPEFGIRRAIRRRQERIIKDLPNTLDLLTISVEAGLGLDQALEVVATGYPGPLADEIRFYLDQLKLGMQRADALKGIGRRTGVEDLLSFATTLAQALEFGVSIATVLRIQSDEVRTRRRQHIEERAMKASVKVLFPLIFMIMPALFVVAAGPGLIRAYIEFAKPVGPGLFAPPPQNP